MFYPYTMPMMPYPQGNFNTKDFELFLDYMQKKRREEKETKRKKKREPKKTFSILEITLLLSSLGIPIGTVELLLINQLQHFMTTVH